MRKKLMGKWQIGGRTSIESAYGLTDRALARLKEDALSKGWTLMVEPDDERSTFRVGGFVLLDTIDLGWFVSMLPELEEDTMPGFIARALRRTT